MLDCCASTLALLGAAVAVLFALRAVAGIAGYLFGGSNPRKYGQWAVVTGATDGIGLAYAKELARRGMNLVLISRSESKLAEAKNQVLQAGKRDVEVKTIQADFSDTSDGLYELIASSLADLEIGVLVNNVGISYEHAAYLTELSEERLKQLIDINVTATTRMTTVVLPGMESRKRGAIINVASAAGVIPCGDPLYAVYSASKAYVDFFSRSLNLELASKGIFVQCQVPYFVVSKMSKIRRSSIMVPTPDNYARHAVAWIGRGGPTVVPYPVHALQHFIFCHLPSFLLNKLVLGHHLGIRKRALRKKSSDKKSD